jgi:hypothetical protein
LVEAFLAAATLRMAYREVFKGQTISSDSKMSLSASHVGKAVGEVLPCVYLAISFRSPNLPTHIITFFIFRVLRVGIRIRG